MTERGEDAALETLFMPFAEDRLPWPEDGALFLRARDGRPLHERKLPGLVCEQSFKPDADAVRRSGLAANAQTDPDRTYSLVLMLPPRQRDEARALMARAIRATKPGGRVIAAVENNAGAKSSEADLARLAGPTNELTTSA